MLDSSSEAVVVTEQGLAIKTGAANVRRTPGMRSVPWSPDVSDNAFDIQVGMGRPAETFLGRSFDGDQKWPARLAAADERINRALAEAVDRHATKDPGMRDILKRDGVVRHPESELQKKIALDTAQDLPPHTPVS